MYLEFKCPLGDSCVGEQFEVERFKKKEKEENKNEKSKNKKNEKKSICSKRTRL